MITSAINGIREPKVLKKYMFCLRNLDLRMKLRSALLDKGFRCIHFNQNAAYISVALYDDNPNADFYSIKEARSRKFANIGLDRIKEIELLSKEAVLIYLEELYKDGTGTT
ncbi:hypothetical protein VBApiPXC38_77 [Acinetobacter phage VB_ApiP_XC38]|uniref:Uncharacterized protein n=1 Tax=Acinetobacter phage VB_ApiP_XC38 TaxID=2655002 RepID=A0A5P8PR46_9CAUD|nr:hypothetical protein KNU81_gp77 [Acinetobacter phage VB_ApiP_XC38]QFR59764.1 hypothetical protein VBApiPXC38_77 [Acinetobacter phage VB_ApiP_XC38]